MSRSVVPVILAGGAGTRLWPASRHRRPKPFLRLDGALSFLQRTWARARLLAPPSGILVAAHEDLVPAVRAELPELPVENLLPEPEAKDTAPAIVRAAWHVAARDADPVIAVLPADHAVADETAFAEVILAAEATAGQEDALVCIGVPAVRPSTGFGYVLFRGGPLHHATPVPVLRFIEKPDAARAAALIAEGSCAWNAGIFVGRASVFLTETLRLGGDLGSALEQLRSDGDVARFFQAAPAISFDRAVLERAGMVWAVGAEMGWDDLGSWDAVARTMETDAAGNAGLDKGFGVDSRGCVVHSLDKAVVLLDVENLIIVETDDVLLVARRDRAQDIRHLPELLRARGLGELS